MLQHVKAIDSGDIALSNLEPSTNQVNRPINLESLSKWVAHIPEDVLEEMDQIAPMLRTLGYDPEENPPNYDQLEQLVL